ncbi:hypothetical protein GCM10020000_81330 [Streptomyces olivoverticillatus]
MGFSVEHGPALPGGGAGTPYSSEDSAQFLEVWHRGHATIEVHIRCGKDTGFGRLPSRHFAINAAWLEFSLATIGLLAWTRVLLLDGELADAEPRKLRYRLLYIAARSPACRPCRCPRRAGATTRGP